MLREHLFAQGLLEAAELQAAPLATRTQIERAHTPAYVDAVFRGTLDPRAERRIGLPWSPALLLRSLASVGGTLAAAHAALAAGIAGNLAGGTHHGHADFGAGYCVFNDFAVTALELLDHRRVRRIAIIDLDVHQGDGNAAILGGRSDVFVLSLHGERNFPFRKVPSTLDVPLGDGTDDPTYLAALAAALPEVLAFAPELVLYQAGVDPLAQDTLGRLSVTLDGLFTRDLLVLSECRRHGIPVVLTLGGGYARPIALTVAAHAGTYRAARHVYQAPSG